MTETKVKAIQPNGTWNSQHGLLYQFEVQLEDGTVGEANSKSETPPFLRIQIEVEANLTF